MPQPPITLSLAEPRHAQAIALLSRDLIEHGLSWGYRPERVRRLINDRDAIVLVAQQASAHAEPSATAGARGEVVGFAAMRFSDERAHLVLMAVSLKHQRQGLGQRIVDWLLASAHTAGVASVHLELRASNRAALAFYRSLGFSATVRMQGYYEGRESAIRMLRVLRSPGAPPPDWQALLTRRLRPD